MVNEGTKGSCDLDSREFALVKREVLSKMSIITIATNYDNLSLEISGYIELSQRVNSPRKAIQTVRGMVWDSQKAGYRDYMFGVLKFPVFIPPLFARSLPLSFHFALQTSQLSTRTQ